MKKTFAAVMLILLLLLFGCAKEDNGYICTVADCYEMHEIWVPSWQAETYCDEFIFDCGCKKL